MKVFAVLFAVLAAASAGFVAPATTLVRAPAFDSAIIKSDRLGGNFAYSTVEGHAYAAVTPVVKNVIAPVGVSYSATPYVANVAAPYVASPYVASPYVASPYVANPYVASPYYGFAK